MSYRNGWAHWSVADQVGTVRMRLDVNGGEEEPYTSLPYGDWQMFRNSLGQWQESNGNLGPLHFTGKPRDPETGLDDFGARYNSSQMGRFMTPDPGPFDWSDPQSLDRYVYGLDNPVRFLDPDGRKPIDAQLLYELTNFNKWAYPIAAQWAQEEVANYLAGVPQLLSPNDAAALAWVSSGGGSQSFLPDTQLPAQAAATISQLESEQMPMLEDQALGGLQQWLGLKSTSPGDIGLAYMAISEASQSSGPAKMKGIAKVMGRVAGPVSIGFPMAGKALKWSSRLLSGEADLDSAYQSYVTSVALEDIKAACRQMTGDNTCRTPDSKKK